MASYLLIKLRIPTKLTIWKKIHSGRSNIKTKNGTKNNTSEALNLDGFTFLEMIFIAYRIFFRKRCT